MANNNDLKCKPQEAIKFLQLLRPDGPWLLIAIDPLAKGRIRARTCSTPKQCEQFIKEYDEQIREYKEQHWGLYYGINPTKEAINRKASKADIADVEYLHGDIDPLKDETPE